MEIKFRIALVDNNIEFLETRSEHLRRAGLIVYEASSIKEARQVLEQLWVHVAVVDIRLENDLDEGDVSGIALAKEAKYQAIPKIIVTNFPRYEYVVDALGPRLTDLPPAVDFISKNDGISALIDAIMKAVNTFIDINWKLQTRWEGRGSFYPALAGRLTPSKEAFELVDHVAELEDLFRMLFSRYHQITIDRFLWQQPGRVAFVVFAFSENLPGRQLVVICGRKTLVHTETYNLDRFGDTSVLVNNMHLAEQRTTLHYAANAYELPGSNLETIKTFEEFYKQNNAREINNVLQKLVQSSLSFWYSKRRIVTGKDLGMLLRQQFNFEPVEPIAASLQAHLDHIRHDAEMVGLASIERSYEGMLINSPGGIKYAFPDPVYWLSHANRLVFKTAIPWATSIRNIQANTILIDSDGRTWLSDFGELIEGPILADFAALETSIKLDLAQSDNLVELHECEQLLMAPDRLDGRVETGPVSLRKAMSAVHCLRTLAVPMCGDDMKQYLLILAYDAVRRILSYEGGIKRTRRDVLPAIHACVTLGVILNRLPQLDSEKNSSVDQNTRGLVVDEVNRQVVVDGHVVILSPTEFDFLHHLWKRAEQLCRRAELYQVIYGEDQRYHQGKASTHDAQLNMLVNRVRKAIELNTGSPQYLVTRRGEGFILYPEGKP